MNGNNRRSLWQKLWNQPSNHSWHFLPIPKWILAVWLFVPVFTIKNSFITIKVFLSRCWTCARPNKFYKWNSSKLSVARATALSLLQNCPFKLGIFGNFLGSQELILEIFPSKIPSIPWPSFRGPGGSQIPTTFDSLFPAEGEFNNFTVARSENGHGRFETMLEGPLRRPISVDSPWTRIKFGALHSSINWLFCAKSTWAEKLMYSTLILSGNMAAPFNEGISFGSDKICLASVPSTQ